MQRVYINIKSTALFHLLPGLFKSQIDAHLLLWKKKGYKKVKKLLPKLKYQVANKNSKYLFKFKEIYPDCIDSEYKNNCVGVSLEIILVTFLFY